ncbi:MAG TPA: membrane dipeptidase [Flavisolibacter sp.]|nr:membrane dipeptidase [Flavisolibacter sp.]
MSIFIDAHCHPTLKHYLYGHSPFEKGGGAQDTNYTNIQVTVPAMQKGGVGAVLAAHYLPEKYIKDDWKAITTVKPLKKFIEHYADKIEKEDAFSQTVEMIDSFEAQFRGKDDALIAHNIAELEKGLADEKCVFVHTVEGGHHLGRGLSKTQYREHIAQLEKRGVAMLTLAHFFANDITTPTEGIPPLQKKLLGMRYTPKPSPLTEVGRSIVNSLLDSRIIVDLTHVNDIARKEVFQLNERRDNKPLVFSHTGARALFKDKEHPQFSLICPDDEELLSIKRCGGLVGIVFMNYYLNGKEERPSQPDQHGIKTILATIKHIAEVTGSFDHITIGTDFDGMSDPPDDLYSYHQFPAFAEQLHAHKDYLGATDQDLEKIKSGNILRVLRTVWR